MAMLVYRRVASWLQFGEGGGNFVDLFQGNLRVPTPPRPRLPPRNKALIAGLIKGNQWLINPDHKAGYFLGGGSLGGGS